VSIPAKVVLVLDGKTLLSARQTTLTRMSEDELGKRAADRRAAAANTHLREARYLSQRIASDLDDLTFAVRSAKSLGATWAEIGAMTAMTRPAALERWGDRTLATSRDTELPGQESLPF